MDRKPDQVTTEDAIAVYCLAFEHLQPKKNVDTPVLNKLIDDVLLTVSKIENYTMIRDFWKDDPEVEMADYLN